MLDDNTDENAHSGIVAIWTDVIVYVNGENDEEHDGSTGPVAAVVGNQENQEEHEDTEVMRRRRP